MNQSKLYEETTQTNDLINRISPLGQTVLRNVEKIVLEHGNDNKGLALALREYGINLKYCYP